MKLEKCVLGGITLYKKTRDTKNATDSMQIFFYNESGSEICQIYLFSKKRDCNDELKKWNPDFNISNCNWQKICSAGGW
ncbi:MAG: hypothetical protein AB1467_05295 [Candidatus Diapherotrites archaeon]